MTKAIVTLSPISATAPAQEYAGKYLERGWCVVPLSAAEKTPIHEGWPARAAAREFNNEDFRDANVGVVLGTVSNHLVDIDLDSQAAIALAPYFLPATLTFGRASKPRSHWLYYSEGVRSQRSWFAVGEGERELVEVRSTNASSDACGHQTAFPGSTHPSGELVEFTDESVEPLTLGAGDLLWPVARLVVASIIAQDWTEGSSRHEKSLGLAGGLLKAGWTADEVRDCLAAVRAVCGDSAANEIDFSHDVECTIRALDNGQDVRGFGALIKDGVLPEKTINEIALHCRTPQTRAKDAVLALTHMGSKLGEHVLATARSTDGMLAEQEVAPALAAKAAESAPTSLLERLKRRTAETAPILATGLAPLDAQLTLKGIPSNKRVVIGGAPDAGKTSLALQIAEHMSSGAVVAWVAVDEDAADIDTRRVQSLGCPRVVAQGVLSPDWLEKVESRLGAHEFHVFENVAVDEVIKWLAGAYPDSPRVVVVDSLQTAHSTNSASATNPRERIDTFLSDVKVAQLAAPCLCIMTSELNRGAYRNRDQSDNVDPMASAKESGSIEYAASLYLVLRSEADGTVSVEIPKNKLGRKEPFRLRFDFVSLRLSAVAETAVAGRQGVLLDGFVEVLKKAKGPMGFEDVKTAARLAGLKFSNADVRDVLVLGTERGRIETVGGHGRQARRYSVAASELVSPEERAAANAALRKAVGQ